MNRTPGKYILVLLLLWSLLHAEDFTFRAEVDNPAPYLKAPVFLSVDINQTNPDLVLLFQFDVRKSDAFLIRQIDAIHDDTMYHTHHHYLYRIYPLKTGPVEIDFDFVKRITDEHKVAYSASGDRDDFKKLETRDVKVSLPPVTLDVKPLPKETRFVGAFTIEREIPKTRVQAYEPIPMKIIVKGRGYPPVTEHLLPRMDGVRIFSQKPEVKRSVNRDGIVYTAVYTFSLSATKDFTLPALSLPAFDPKEERRYTLSLPAQHFKVEAVDAQTLVDKVDNPRPMQADFSWIGSLFGCLAVFAAGYLTALSLRWKRRSRSTLEDPLREKVEACKDAKSLMQLLMAADSKRFETAIEKLEKGLYGQEKLDFKKIKKEILERMK